jgi:hypothetical protein
LDHEQDYNYDYDFKNKNFRNQTSEIEWPVIGAPLKIRLDRAAAIHQPKSGDQHSLILPDRHG